MRSVQASACNIINDSYYCPKGYCVRGSKNRCSSHVRLVSVTLKTTFLRRGNGGGTCLRLSVFCRKVPKFTPLDPVLEHLFCSFRVNLGTSVIKKCAKNDALDPVLEHSFCSFRVNLGKSVIKKCAKNYALEHPFCSFRVNPGTSVIKKCTTNNALDPVLEHLFVVSELTWEHP